MTIKDQRQREKHEGRQLFAASVNKNADLFHLNKNWISVTFDYIIQKYKMKDF